MLPGTPSQPCVVYMGVQTGYYSVLGGKDNDPTLPDA